MIEKTYCGKDTEITLTKAELECMIAEAEERGYCKGAEQSKKIERRLSTVNELIRLLIEE